MVSHFSPTFSRRLFLALTIVLMVLTTAVFVGPVSASASNSSAPSSQSNSPTCRWYVVKRGDTLRKLATRFGVSVADIVRANHLANADRITIGQRLCIPVQPRPTPAPKTWPAPDVAIELFSPVSGGRYHSPIEIIGFARTFEGNVNIRLKLEDGTLLAERNVTGGSTAHAFFQSSLRFETFTEEPAPGLLEVFETSAVDGAEINKVTIPLTLAPGQRVLDITGPRVGARVCNPVLVTGYSFTFEGNLALSAQQRDGAPIWEGFATGGGGDYRDWSASAGPLTPPAPFVLLSIREPSALDGAAIDETRIPVTLLPAGDQACP